MPNDLVDDVRNQVIADLRTIDLIMPRIEFNEGHNLPIYTLRQEKPE